LPADLQAIKVRQAEIQDDEGIVPGQAQANRVALTRFGRG
jgi:hypothetical protein